MTTLRSKTIPGPRSLNPLKTTLAFRREPLRFIGDLQKQYGDIAQFRLAIWPMVFINHPDYIKRILQDNHLNYDKDVLFFQVARPVVGKGVATVAGGHDWLRQRRLLQPAFHRQRIAALGTLITDDTSLMLQQWDIYARERRVFNVDEEMTNLTFQIIGQSLFNVDVSPKNHSFRQAFLQVNAFLIEYMATPFPPVFIPTSRNRRFLSAIETMDSLTYEIIRNRRRLQEDVGDLLSMMLNTKDENGQGMSDKELRDEIMTMLVAGHETAAHALAWACYLLAQHPEVEERLHAELDQILAGRTPRVEDLPQLRYTRMVVEEALRLYPTAWLLMRRAIQDDEIGGYSIPAKSSLLWSSYFAHRHPDFWEKPEQFYPEHFSEELSAKRPGHAYIPFSSGPRVCMGNSFAMTEMQLILATIAQQYRVSIAPGYRAELKPLMTIRPKNGILISIEHR
jgi:cytochrome P450